MTNKPSKPVKNKVRIIYQPLAGKAKTLTKNIDPNGTVTINDGTHHVPSNSMGQWKGKKPWCRINQNQLVALPWHGDTTIPSPQFFNEAVNNHYARDTLEGLENIDGKKDKATMVYVMLGSLIAVVLAMSFWILKDVSNLHDVMAVYVQLAQAHSGGVVSPGVTDSSVVTNTGAPLHA